MIHVVKKQFESKNLQSESVKRRREDLGELFDFRVQRIDDFADALNNLQ